MGLNAQCHNISLPASCTKPFKLDPDNTDNIEGTADYANCTYTFPSGFQSETMWEIHSDNYRFNNFPSTAEDFWPFPFTISEGSLQQGEAAQTGGKGAIVDFWMVDYWSTRSPVHYQGAPSKATFEAIKPKAFQCDLSWSVQTYADSRVENGKLIDSFRSSKPLTKLTGAEYGCFMPADDGYWCPLALDEGRLPSKEEIRASFPSSLNDSQPKEAFMDVFWMKNNVEIDIRNALAAVVAFRDSGMESRSPVGRALMYGLSFPDFADNIAVSLTHAMRDLDFTSVEITGVVTRPVTHVHVNWPWITFPAAIVLLTTIFLASSIVFSFERGGLIWKSSDLPLIFMPFGEQIRDASENFAGSLKQMESSAEGMYAYLTEDSRGFAFLRKS